MCEQCGPADDDNIEELVQAFLARREAAARQAAEAKAAAATKPSVPSPSEAAHA